MVYQENQNPTWRKKGVYLKYGKNKSKLIYKVQEGTKQTIIR